MSVMWVILNQDKTEIVELYETVDADSARHWDKFFQYDQGTVFCRRGGQQTFFGGNLIDVPPKWYVSYFYWNDPTSWGVGHPCGLAWSVCMALPDVIKMLEYLE